MKLTNKILSMLAIAGLLFSTGCSDESEDDPNPEVAVKTCQLTGLNEISDGENYNTTCTYDANGNLTKLVDPDETTIFDYTDNKLTTITIDESKISVSYNGTDLPYRLDFDEDGEDYYFILKSENGRYVSFESFGVVNGIPYPGESTKITYDANGNVSSVIYSELNEDSEELEERIVARNITFDDNKNPYTTSPALMVLELLDGNEVNLGVNNPLSYTANFGSDVAVSNIYEYNEEGYPTKRVESGFSSTPTTYDFSYKCD